MRRQLIAILSAAFVLAMVSPVAFGQGVKEGALIDLNATDTAKLSWRNLGAAGGVFPLNLDAGRIGGHIFPPPPKFSAAEGKNPAHFTASVPESSFGGKRGTAPEIMLGNWTVEVWLRRNGEMVEPAEENGFVFFGFIPEDLHNAGDIVKEAMANDIQYIRMLVDKGAKGQIIAEVKPKGKKAVTLKTDEGIGTGDWHQVALTYDGKTVQSYIDSKADQASKMEGWDKAAKMGQNFVFVAQPGDHDFVKSSFNGSLAIVRVYGEDLGAGGVRNNFIASLAVEPADKLTTTWGRVKQGY